MGSALRNGSRLRTVECLKCHKINQTSSIYDFIFLFSLSFMFQNVLISNSIWLIRFGFCFSLYMLLNNRLLNSAADFFSFFVRFRDFFSNRVIKYIGVNFQNCFILWQHAFALQLQSIEFWYASNGTRHFHTHSSVLSEIYFMHVTPFSGLCVQRDWFI